MNTSEKIKALRVQKGLSQEALGELVGLQKAAINKYEKGRVVNIKKSMLAKLADALDVSPADLLDDPIEESQDSLTIVRLRSLNLDDKDLEFIELYSKLPVEKKQAFIQMLKTFIE